MIERLVKKAMAGLEILTEFDAALEALLEQK